MGIIPYSANTLNNSCSLPNKFFEYISAGIPILSNKLFEIKKYNFIKSLLLTNVNDTILLEKRIWYLSKNNNLNCNLLKKDAKKYVNFYDWSRSYKGFILEQIKTFL